jgi:hypothetical protein
MRAIAMLDVDFPTRAYIPRHPQLPDQTMLSELVTVVGESLSEDRTWWRFCAVYCRSLIGALLYVDRFPDRD